MAKTELTLQLEKEIHDHTKRIGLVGCTEVSIGKGGKEFVDYMTIDSKNIVRCYEIKVSKSDFYSKAKKSFHGHYNYYVMPKELFDQVEKDIPSHIGVYCENKGFIKNPKKQELKININILKTSMMFALYREACKGWDSVDLDNLKTLNSRVSYWKNKYEKESKTYMNDHKAIQREIRLVERYLRENNLLSVEEILKLYQK